MNYLKKLLIFFKNVRINSKDSNNPEHLSNHNKFNSEKAVQEAFKVDIDQYHVSHYTNFLKNGFGQTYMDFDEAANEEDVYNCYRLLLGRTPERDGWNTWASAVKSGTTSIKTLVLGFLSSPEFKNRNIFPSIGETKYALVDLNTFKIYVPTDDWAVGKTILEQKSYEPHVTSTIKTILSSGMVFVDIGANIGYFTLMAAAIVGTTGKVFSFEPNQHNCQCLYLSAKHNSFDNIDIYPFAVAEQKTSFVYDNLGTNGVISEFDDNLSTLESRTLVRSVVLDEVLHNVERIDLIKIDIEGAEFRALEGANNIIQRHRPIILSEFSPPALQNVSRVSGEKYLQKLTLERYYISVIEGAERVTECADDIDKVMKIFDSHQSSHIDIIAYPQ